MRRPPRVSGSRPALCFAVATQRSAGGGSCGLRPPTRLGSLAPASPSSRRQRRPRRQPGATLTGSTRSLAFREAASMPALRLRPAIFSSGRLRRRARPALSKAPQGRSQDRLCWGRPVTRKTPLRHPEEIVSLKNGRVGSKSELVPPLTVRKESTRAQQFEVL